VLSAQRFDDLGLVGGIKKDPRALDPADTVFVAEGPQNITELNRSCADWTTRKRAQTINLFMGRNLR
jgi:hypothetical protein